MLVFASSINSESREIIEKLILIYKKRDKVYSNWGKSVPFEIVFIPCNTSPKRYHQDAKNMPWPSLYHNDGLVQIMLSKFQIECLATIHRPRIVLISPEDVNGDSVVSLNVTDVLLQRTWYSENQSYFENYYTFAVMLRYCKDYTKRLNFIATFKKKSRCERDSSSGDSNFGPLNLSSESMTTSPRTKYNVAEDETEAERVYQFDNAYRRTGNTVRRCVLRHGYPNIKIKARKCLRDFIEPLPIEMSDCEMRGYDCRAYADCYFPNRTLYNLPDSMVYRRGPKSGSRYLPMKSKRMNKGKNSRLY